MELAFQRVAEWFPPRWPDAAYPQQLHLDIRVHDAELAEHELCPDTAPAAARRRTLRTARRGRTNHLQSRCHQPMPCRPKAEEDRRLRGASGLALGHDGRVLIVRATKKLLGRIGPPSLDEGEQSTTLMGQWCATALFWKPQVALFVNEPTLLPV